MQMSQRFHVSARLASSVLGASLADKMSTIIELLLGKYLKKYLLGEVLDHFDLID